VGFKLHECHTDKQALTVNGFVYPEHELRLKVCENNRLMPLIWRVTGDSERCERPAVFAEEVCEL
jgi:hypothetical protein